MGSVTNNIFIKNYCSCCSSEKENKIIIINLDINDSENNKDKKNENNNGIKNGKENNKELFSSNNQNNHIIIYNFHSKFKSRIKSINANNSKNFIKISDNTKSNNKYNVNNEQCEKLIHFTNFNNNTSVTTNSIIK